MAVLVSPSAEPAVVTLAGRIVARIRETDANAECLVVAAAKTASLLPPPPHGAVIALSAWTEEAKPDACLLSWIDASLLGLRPRHIIGDMTALLTAAPRADRLATLRSVHCLAGEGGSLRRSGRRRLEELGLPAELVTADAGDDPVARVVRAFRA